MMTAAGAATLHCEVEGVRLRLMEQPDWRGTDHGNHAAPVPALDSCVYLREK